VPVLPLPPLVEPSAATLSDTPAVLNGGSTPVPTPLPTPQGIVGVLLGETITTIAPPGPGSATRSATAAAAAAAAAAGVNSFASGAQAPTPTGRSAGRVRQTINYSALAGKKDKDRERGSVQEEREVQARPVREPKSTAPKYKRKGAPKAGNSWSAGSGAGGGVTFGDVTYADGVTPGAGLGSRGGAGGAASAIGKVVPLFMEDPGANACTAAVHALVSEGRARGWRGHRVREALRPGFAREDGEGATQRCYILLPNRVRGGVCSVAAPRPPS
jgi:hypothetical protein